MKFKKHTSPKLLHLYKSKLSSRDWGGMIDFYNLERCFDTRKAASAGRIRISNQTLNRLRGIVDKRLSTTDMELVTIAIGRNVDFESYNFLVSVLGVTDCRVKVLHSVLDEIDVRWVEYG